MKDTRQRVAIASACGFKFVYEHFNKNRSGKYSIIFKEWRKDDEWYEELPDYLNDLNAMREAEEMLNPEQRKIYSERLSFLLRDQESRQPFYDLMFVTLHAPAHLRAKAFLQTIKKWKDSEPLNPSESKGTEVTCND